MTETDLRTALIERGVPIHLHDGLVRYVMFGCPVGGFLTAVLSNDLMESSGRADDQSRASMFEICSFLHNDVPGSCHGSPERVREWIEKGGLEGEGERV